MSQYSAVSPAPLRRPITSSVRSIDGARLFFDLYDAPSSALALVIPGFWRDRRHPSMVQFARLLNDTGFQAAILDVRGHGDSEGRYGFNRYEHFDVAAVAEKLLSSGRVASVVLAGFSLGGAIAISTAARHELPLSGLLLISPVADLALIRPKINLLTLHRHIAFAQAFSRPRFDWRFATAAKLRAVDEIGEVHVPVCLIHVKDDWLVGHHHSVVLYEQANEPKELHVIDAPGNYHADRIFAAAGAEVVPIVRGFLEGRLREDHRRASGDEPDARGD